MPAGANPALGRTIGVLPRNAWIRKELERQSRVPETGRVPIALLSLTRKEVSMARDLAAWGGTDPDQEFSGPRDPECVRPGHHDAVYRAAPREGERPAREGVRVGRIRLESELTPGVLRRCRIGRRHGGQPASDAGRHRAAIELGLPIDPEGRVICADVQIEYIAGGGRTGRVNIEVTPACRRPEILRMKAAAGFRMLASGAAAERVLGRLRLPGPAGRQVVRCSPGGSAPGSLPRPRGRPSSSASGGPTTSGCTCTSSQPNTGSS